MKAEKIQKEGASRAIQTKLGSRGRMYMEDNRPEAVGQAKFINAIQAKSTPRNVIQRANEGGDNDKGNIQVTDIPREDIQMDVSRGGHNTTIAKLQFSDEKSYIGQLKHYMVVKNGALYQFPVKYLYEPGWDTKTKMWIPNDSINHRHLPPDFKSRPPTMARTYGDRANQPEGFGGNQDWIFGDHTSGQMSLFGSRNFTLAHEYKEEARLDDAKVGVHSGDAARSHYQATEDVASPQSGYVELSVVRSKLFGATYPRPKGDPRPPIINAGTLSIASTDALIRTHLHPKEKVSERGMAEMAGTIVIDCNKLIGNPMLKGDKLEEEIGTLIKNARNTFWGFGSSSSSSSTPSSSSSSPSADPFANEGGILARLVEMVAEDIMAQREATRSSSSSSSSTPSFSSSTPTSSSSSSSPSAGIEERSEDSESVSEKEPGKTKNVSKEESAEEDSKKESQTDDASEEDVDEEEETDAVEENGAEEESQTDDVSEERPEHSQSRGWFSTIFGAPWRWIKRLFSNLVR